MSKPHLYQAKGKFLLSSEYFVLDGALALALPLQYGQTLAVTTLEGTPSIQWQSYTHKNQLWFEGIFDGNTQSIIRSTDEKTATTLKAIFQSIYRQAPAVFKNGNAYQIQTHLDFPREWGLGTSSTLIHLLAQWSATSPYVILDEAFGGSGYDIACAGASGSIFYKKTNEQVAVQASDFSPPFKNKLYFLYLGNKQNSREGIAHYRQLKIDKAPLIKELSEITLALNSSKTLKEFDALIAAHETIISEALQIPKAKVLHFPDFWGEVKSLGAWGGDFVLVSSEETFEKTKAYFNEKGFEVFFRYEDMVYDQRMR